MSFSVEIKNEVSKVSGMEECCKRAELAGIVAFSAIIGDKLKINTESAAVARRVSGLLKELCGVNMSVRNKKTESGSFYSITVENTEKILMRLGITLLPFKIHSGVVKRDCCARAFVRGAFEGGGSIVTPEKSYHIEFSTRHPKIQETIEAILNRFDIRAKKLIRKGYYIAYLKSGEAVSDILALMGAHKTMMKFMNIKIVKEMRNTANRLVNCETANLDKIINASQEQIRAIKLIDKKVGLGSLSPEFRTLARLRLNNPEYSLQELGNKLSPPLSKSAVNRRMQKLIQYSFANKS